MNAVATGAEAGNGARAVRFAALRTWVWLPLFLVCALAVVLGLREGQWQEVDSWFNAICSACIGLTFH